MSRLEEIRANLLEPGGYSSLAWKQAVEDVEWLLSTNDALLAALKLAEWGGTDGYGPSCPVCDSDEKRGHEKNCNILLAMAAAEGKGQPPMGRKLRGLTSAYESELEKLRTQRDALLAALKDVLRWAGKDKRYLKKVGLGMAEQNQSSNRAYAAIAAAEGKE
jgi:hypothetical protein